MAAYTTVVVAFCPAATDKHVEISLRRDGVHVQTLIMQTSDLTTKEINFSERIAAAFMRETIKFKTITGMVGIYQET